RQVLEAKITAFNQVLSKAHCNVLLPLLLPRRQILKHPGINTQVFEIVSKICVQEASEFLIAALAAKLHLAPAQDMLRKLLRSIKALLHPRSPISISAKTLLINGGAAEAGGEFLIRPGSANIGRHRTGKFSFGDPAFALSN